MKIDFCVSVDPCVHRFLEANEPLQKGRGGALLRCLLTREHIQESEEILNRSFLEWIFHSCKNSMREKSRRLFSFYHDFPNRIPDVLIRVDADAIIKDYQWLEYEARILHKEKEPTVCGNWNRRGWLRGACLLINRQAIESIYSNDTAMSALTGEGAHDPAFAEACSIAGVQQIPVKLFEESYEYQGTAPVWHPKKKGGVTDRYNLFMKEINRAREQHEVNEKPA